MAVLAVKEQVDERSGWIDQQWHRHYRLGFLVEVSDPAEAELSVLLDPRIPRPNAPHPVDAVAKAEKPEVSVPDADMPYLRRVVVPYSTRSEDPDRQNSDQSQSPVLKPPVARWGHVAATRLFTKTADNSPVRKIVNGADAGDASFVNVTSAPTGGWPVQNTAGESYDQAPETEERRLTLEYVQNRMTFDPIVADSYVDTTNEDTWLGMFGPGTARCVRYSGERAYEKNTPYYVVTLAFEFAPDWDLVIRDYGHYSIDDSGGSGDLKQVKPVATNGAGLPFVNLDGSGKKLADDQPPVYLGFRRFPRKDYNALNVTNL